MNTTYPGIDPGTPVSSRSERWLLASLVLIALAFHLFFVRGARVVWGDEPFYLWLGKNWLTGQGYQFLGFTDVHHPPLVPLLAGVLYLALGSLEQASNALYVVFGALLVLPMAGIARRLYGQRVGLLAGLLVALWPVFNAAIPWWGTMTEPPFYFFAAVGLWAAIAAAGLRRDDLRGREAAEAATTRGDGGPLWAWGLAGLAFGLAYLTRPEGIWYVPAVGGVLVLIAWFTRQPWRRWLAGAALFGLGFLVCFFPYAVHTRIHTGGWMVSEKVGITFQDSLALARNDLAEHDRVLWQLDATGEQVYFFSEESFHLSMVDEIRANPRRYASLVYLNVRSLLSRFFTVQDFMPIFLPLLGLGLFGVIWDRRRLRGELVLLAALLPPLTFLFFFIFERYLAPLLLPMLIWTAFGLELLCHWARGTAARLLPQLGERWLRVAWLTPAAAVVVLLLVIHPETLRAATATQAFRTEHRTAGEWLAANAPADAVIMARYPAMAFHADRRWIPSPNSEYPAALRYAAANGADYWVVDANESAWRPQLAFLTEGEPPPELELVYRAPTDGKPVLVYRLQKGATGN
jgi:4-amino-4-deoxy-L-arabinose transferase-like glycosyltransferase